MRPDDIISADAAAPASSTLSDGTVAQGTITDWLAVIWSVGCHLLALLVFVPWFFSWTGVVLLVLGIHVFGMIGINLGFHRLLTHRSFSCPLWLERSLAILGVCCAHEAPAYWVAVHRRHHHFADKDLDPHSPRESFFWGHIGWIARKSEDMLRGPMTRRYAQDLLRDPLYVCLEDHFQAIVLVSWAIFLVGGLSIGLLMGMSTHDAVQFSLSIFIWGVVVRTVYVWHVSCFVNSVTHLWGYRTYETRDESRNNLFVGYFAHGEGWHNNHHADPSAAMHGHRAWEFDPVFWCIRILAALGLAKDIVMPRRLWCLDSNAGRHRAFQGKCPRSSLTYGDAIRWRIRRGGHGRSARTQYPHDLSALSPWAFNSRRPECALTGLHARR